MKVKKNRKFHRFLQKQTRWGSVSILLMFLVHMASFAVASLTTSEESFSMFIQTSSPIDGWEQIDSGVTQDLNSVFFICLNRGTIVGDDGVILRTGDGGDNWTAQDSGVMDNLYGVSYYGYTKTLVVGASGTLLYTNNSGVNWTVLQTGMMATYYSCQMVTETMGVAVGVNTIFQPFVTWTTNGWDTWESTSFYIEHDAVFYEGKLTDVVFINASVGFASAIVDLPSGGAIVRTMDGGSTWETVLFYDEPLFSMDFPSETVGYAVGNQGAVVQTLDGGVTWQDVDSGVTIAFYAVDFSSETTGTLVGDNGNILRTEDGGLSWTVQPSGTTYNLLGIQCVTDMFGVVVGEHGMILRTSTGGYPEDSTPPETTVTLSGTMEGDVYISNVQITFTATDDLSGIAVTMYKLDEGPWTVYDSPVPLIVAENGYHQLLFYSIDNAGNIEPENICEFTIQHPPNLQITMTGGFGITVGIKNLDITDLTGIPWSLTLDGGFILFGKQKSGFGDIHSGEELMLHFLVIGFGKPMITFTMESSQSISQGRIFLFFVRI